VKLCIDARKAFDSGIGVVIRSLLGQWQSNGLSITAICNSIAQKEDLSSLFPGCRYLVVRAANYSVQEQLKIPWTVTGDVFWSPHYNVPIGVRVPIVSTVHDVLPLAHPGLFAGIAKQVYANVMFRMCAVKSKVVVCVSRFTLSEFTKFTGCSRKKTCVVHNGVSPHWFRLERQQNTIDPYFLIIGNLKPHKNLSRLIGAFQNATSTPNYRLIVAGESRGFITSDPHGLTLAKHAQRVEFVGSLSDEQLVKLMAGASALVLPSLYEGFGLPALEALAAGVPVIASDIPPLREVCGECATYFDPMSVDSIASALVAVGTSRLGDHQREARGKDRARLFLWEKAGQAYTRAFQEAAGIFN
jgi:glycosyltransferase involved in cell wall biosynthesis